METLVIEISQEVEKLKMSALERIKGADITLRHYSECSISNREIKGLCDDITELLNKANRHGQLVDNLSSELRKIGQLLYDQLLTVQVKEKIKTTKAKFLIFSIDEQLVQIPWELLFDGGKFLCLRFAIGRSVRTKQRPYETKYRNLNVPLKMLALVDPTGTLKAAYDEGIAIRNELDKKKNRVKVDLKTTDIDLRFVKRNIRDYDIVHFAGHADYNVKNPSESGWILKDGKLTSKDIVTLGSSAPLPTLVFSNACQSGKTQEWKIEEGFEDKIYGLANAFLLAGVKYYIGTFWKVLDEACLLFSKEFYRNLITGVSVGEAMRLARIKLIEKYGEASIIWSSYMLYGDPSFSLFISKTTFVVSQKQSSKFKKTILISLSMILIFGMILGFSYFLKITMGQPPTFSILKFENVDTKTKDWEISQPIIENLRKISSANLVVFELGQNELLIDAARRSSVKKIIDGDYKKKDDSYIINLRAINAKDGKITKTKRVSIKDDVELSEELSLIVLDMLKIGLSEREKAELLRKPTENPQAYKLFVKTWDLFLKGDYEKVLKLCNKTIEIDPGYLDVYKRMGDTYDRMGRRDEALGLYYKYAELSKKNNDLANLANAYYKIGWIMELKNRNNEAYNYYNRTLETSRLINDSLCEAKAYCALASWYGKKQDYDKSIQLLLKSIEINKNREYIYNHRYQLAANYNHMGIILDGKGDYDDALEYYNKSLDIFKSIGAEKVVEEVKERINKVYSKQKEEVSKIEISKSLAKDRKSQAAKAMPAGKKTILFPVESTEQILKSDQNILEAYSLYCEAIDYRDEGKYYEAIELCKKSYKRNPKCTEPLCILGQIYEALGEWDAALSYYNQAADIYKTNQDKISLALISIDIGWLYEKLEKEKEAIKCYNRTRVLGKELGNVYILAKAYNVIGLWHSSWELDDKAALQYLLKARNIFEKQESKEDLSMIYNNIGLVYISLYEFNKAKEYFSKNFELLKELENKPGLLIYYGNMGYLYSQKGEYKEAVKAYQESLKLAEELSSAKDIIDIQVDIADIYVEKGENVDALSWYLKALEFYKSRGLKHGSACIYDSIGYVYAKMDNFDNAFKFIDIAMSLYKELGNKEGTSICYNTQGAAYFYKKDYDKALECYKLALKESEYDKLSKFEDYAIYGNIGEVYYKKGDYDRALELYSKALEYSEKCKDKPCKAWIYQYMGLAYEGKGIKKTAVDYLTKGRDLVYEMGIEKAREYQEGLNRLKELSNSK